jgi:hypothetical protein
VVKRHAFNPEIRLEQNAAGTQIGRSAIARAEGVACPESRPRSDTSISKLGCQNRKIRRVGIEQIPEIAVKLGGDSVDQPRRADELEQARPIKRHPEQTVETGEMIHVSMSHKYIGHAQQLSGRERRKVAEIK